MRRKDVKTIIAYYFDIPAMRAEQVVERAKLEDAYNGLRGVSADGMPHSSTSGNPTEELAERVSAAHVRDRLEAVSIRLQVLEADREKIRDCLDTLKGEYKRILFYRYQDRYSWVKIAAIIGVQERTVYRRRDKALDRLGETLEETPMLEELLGRASRARI